MTGGDAPTHTFHDVSHGVRVAPELLADVDRGMARSAAKTMALDAEEIPNRLERLQALRDDVVQGGKGIDVPAPEPDTPDEADVREPNEISPDEE